MAEKVSDFSMVQADLRTFLYKLFDTVKEQHL